LLSARKGVENKDFLDGFLVPPLPGVVTCVDEVLAMGGDTRKAREAIVASGRGLKRTRSRLNGFFEGLRKVGGHRGAQGCRLPSYYSLARSLPLSLLDRSNQAKERDTRHLFGCIAHFA
jgi:hypothetical protein